MKLFKENASITNENNYLNKIKKLTANGNFDKYFNSKDVSNYLTRAFVFGNDKVYDLLSLIKNNSLLSNHIKDISVNDIIEDNCFISIYCSKKELIQEYKYKLLSKLQRRLGKQLALIKQAKREINSEGYNYTYGGIKVFRKRLMGLKCAYNFSKDESISIKGQVDKLEEIIKIK